MVDLSLIRDVGVLSEIRHPNWVLERLGVLVFPEWVDEGYLRINSYLGARDPEYKCLIGLHRLVWYYGDES